MALPALTIRSALNALVLNWPFIEGSEPEAKTLPCRRWTEDDTVIQATYDGYLASVECKSRSSAATQSGILLELGCTITANSLAKPAPAEVYFDVLLPKGVHWQALGRDLQWRSLSSPVWVDALTPKQLHAELPDLHAYFEVEAGVPLAKFHSKCLRLYLDHFFLHPRYGHHDGQRSYRDRRKWRTLSARLCFCISPTPTPSVMIQRWPFGRDAAFVLTDHCDHDTPEKIEALCFGKAGMVTDTSGKGLVGQHLPITKGVFWVSQPRIPQKTWEVGLEDDRYRSAIEKYAAAGAEICPHGLAPRGALESEQIAERLALFRNAFPDSRTWIDHGFLPYNYTMHGWNPDVSDYLLVHLQNSCYRFIWSYLDLFNTSGLRLNMIGSGSPDWKPARDVWAQIRLQTRLWLQRKSGLSQMIYPFKEFIKLVSVADSAQIDRFTSRLRHFIHKKELRMLADSVRLIPQVVLKSLLPQNWRTIVRRLKGMDDLSICSPVVYHEDGRNLDERCDRDVSSELFVFTTVLINDPINAYDPENIDDLIRQKGVHIGHIYLAQNVQHLASNAVYNNFGSWEIHPLFQRNLEHISRQRDLGRLWVTTMADLGAYLVARSRVSVRRVGTYEWQFENGHVEQDGVTLQCSHSGFGLVVQDDEGSYSEKAKNTVQLNSGDCLRVRVVNRDLPLIPES